MPDDQAFLQHLREIFRVEADEHLRAMAALLGELQSPGADERRPTLVESLFREAHSLKGAARSVGLGELESVCAGLESRLAALKRQELEPTPALFDELDRALEALGDQLATSGAKTPPPAPAVPVVSPAPTVPAGSAATTERTPVAMTATSEGSETVRIATAKLSALLVQAEELLTFKVNAGHLGDELRTICAELSDWKKARAKNARELGILRRSRERAGNGGRNERQNAIIDRLGDAIERDELSVKSLLDRLSRLRRLAEQDRRSLGGIAGSLQDEMKQALMQPFAALLELLPKLVRDLARDGGKEVELRLDGTAIEIDRRILEQMKDPLIHLVRNAIDHGIEAPEQRQRRGKVRQGRLTLTVTPREGNQVELLLADDGAGIDLDKVRAAALKLGLLAPDAAPRAGAAELLPLVFESGLSTSPMLTDISGRGLGLAIVREKVEKLGGSVGIEQPAEGGTRFRIVLPTTLANFHGLLVALGERQFVLPSRNVERVARVTAASVKTVENREAIELAGQALALVRLADVLSLPARADGEHLALAVLVSAGKRIAFAVDAVLGDQEVLVKALGPQLRRVRHIAGVTVLGAGNLVPILSVPDLFTSALRAAPRAAQASPASAPVAGERQSLLVVEDSITSRALLKNILESSGYAVSTAVDGIDALTVLRTGKFDLVVSDVEMPRLDGFDLTARIRQDKKFAELPVVLVTALESREHRERGIDVGANAYIVKSSFDQSNLLEVIRRLI